LARAERDSSSIAFGPCVKGELQQNVQQAENGNPLLQLSVREREVLLLLVKQISIDHIAELLNVASSTVRTYRSRIAQKLGVDSADELVRHVLKYNLTEIV
jgi:DNA-binding NarL/FixJ family response regulator